LGLFRELVHVHVVSGRAVVRRGPSAQLLQRLIMLPFLGRQLHRVQCHLLLFEDQPFHHANAFPGIGSGINLVYLDVWQREVTSWEDDRLIEAALGGPDTATRVQTAWQVKALSPVASDACDNPPQAWLDLIYSLYQLGTPVDYDSVNAVLPRATRSPSSTTASAPGKAASASCFHLGKSVPACPSARVSKVLRVTRHRRARPATRLKRA